MKTANLIINESKGTITFVNPSRTLSAFEEKIVRQYQKQGFVLRQKRKINKNASHKRDYYNRKFEKMENGATYKALFEAIEAHSSFATAVKWYRNLFESKNIEVVELIMENCKQDFQQVSRLLAVQTLSLPEVA